MCEGNEDQPEESGNMGRGFLYPGAVTRFLLLCCSLQGHSIIRGAQSLGALALNH